MTTDALNELIIAAFVLAVLLDVVERIQRARHNIRTVLDQADEENEK